MFGTFSIDKIENPEYAKAALRGAIRHWGPDLQMVKAVEELGELQRALAREMIWRKLGEGDHREILHNLEEEWADATIMLLQIGLMFDFGGAMVSSKLQRLMHRLNAEGECLFDDTFMDDFTDYINNLRGKLWIELDGKTWKTELEVE